MSPPPTPNPITPLAQVGSVRSVCVVAGRAHARLVGEHGSVDSLCRFHHAPIADGTDSRPASAGL